MNPVVGCIYRVYYHVDRYVGASLLITNEFFDLEMSLFIVRSKVMSIDILVNFLQVIITHRYLIAVIEEIHWYSYV